jgi:catechol-2,3-dioxygenase
MKTCLKAVVLKTSRLGETRDFFENILGMKIEETSTTHFVIPTKGIRVLFVGWHKGPEIELYFTRKSCEGLTIREDPNQFKIIIS